MSLVGVPLDGSWRRLLGETRWCRREEAKKRSWREREAQRTEAKEREREGMEMKVVREREQARPSPHRRWVVFKRSERSRKQRAAAAADQSSSQQLSRRAKAEKLLLGQALACRGESGEGRGRRQQASPPLLGRGSKQIASLLTIKDDVDDDGDDVTVRRRWCKTVTCCNGMADGCCSTRWESFDDE